MKKEEKDLLLRDLSARLPYSVKINVAGDWFEDEREPYDMILDYSTSSFLNVINQNDKIVAKPYLRLMKSMTDEEKEFIQQCIDIVSDENYGDGYSPSAWDWMNKFVNYCDSHHLDHRGLIWRELALEAPEGMYDIK